MRYLQHSTAQHSMTTNVGGYWQQQTVGLKGNTAQVPTLHLPLQEVAHAGDRQHWDLPTHACGEFKDEVPQFLPNPATPSSNPSKPHAPVLIAGPTSHLAAPLFLRCRRIVGGLRLWVRCGGSEVTLAPIPAGPGPGRAGEAHVRVLCCSCNRAIKQGKARQGEGCDGGVLGRAAKIGFGLDFRYPGSRCKTPTRMGTHAESVS